jgi:hypothetical protein
MRTISISLVTAVLAMSACKKKQNEPKAEPAAPTTAAKPVADPAPAPPAAAPDTTASADTIGGSRSKSPTATLKLDLPDSWDRIDNDDGGRLETYSAVNDSKFPVDNAVFTFEYGPAAASAPSDAAKFGEWHALEMKTKVDKTEVIGDATYYAFAGARGAKDGDKYWLVVKKVGDKLWQCGGSLYNDADYNKIPKERDEQLATAKKICASMKL